MDYQNKPLSQVFLTHHGILGQKWGVRRYQNPDGSYTSEGKRHYNTSSYTKPIRALIDSLTETQRNYIGDGYWIDKNRTVYRNVIGDSQRIDAFLDVYNLPREHNGEGTVVLAVSNDKSGQGYATKLAKQLIQDYETGKFGNDLSNLIWRVDEGNTASDKVAQKAGFIYEGIEEDFGEKLNVYRYYKTGHTSKKELQHHGILGQKWGVRRFQNQDGTLTEAGKARLEKKDDDWAKKNSVKITEKAQKKSAKELDRYATKLLQTPGAFNKTGKLSSAAITAYNQKMSELMTQKVSDLRTPSGKVVKFVAKRGEIGVMIALADAGYDMEQLKKGVWASGRVAYKKTVLDKV